MNEKKLTQVVFQHWSNGRLIPMEDKLHPIDGRCGHTKRVPKVLELLDLFIRQTGLLPEAYSIRCNGEEIDSGPLECWTDSIHPDRVGYWSPGYQQLGSAWLPQSHPGISSPDPDTKHIAMNTNQRPAPIPCPIIPLPSARIAYGVRCASCGGPVTRPKRGPVGRTCSARCRVALYRRDT